MPDPTPDDVISVKWECGPPPHRSESFFGGTTTNSTDFLKGKTVDEYMADMQRFMKDFRRRQEQSVAAYRANPTTCPRCKGVVAISDDGCEFTLCDTVHKMLVEETDRIEQHDPTRVGILDGIRLNVKRCVRLPTLSALAEKIRGA